MKYLLLALFALFMAERKYSLRIGKVKGTTKVAIFYDTEDEEGNDTRGQWVIFDLSKIIKDGK